MNEKHKSMEDDKLWELIPLSKGTKSIGCKWIFKTKCDANDIKAVLWLRALLKDEGLTLKRLPL